MWLSFIESTSTVDERSGESVYEFLKRRLFSIKCYTRGTIEESEEKDV